MKREIMSRHYYRPKCAPRDGRAVIVTLTCGHEKRFKASNCPARWTRCGECAK